MNLTAMKDIIADSIYYDPWPGALKRQSQTKSIVCGKINPKEELFFVENAHKNIHQYTAHLKNKQGLILSKLETQLIIII